VNDIFKVIAAIDFEYEVAAGGSPVVLCLVVYVLDQFLRHVQTIRLWRDDFGSKPPFDIGPDALGGQQCPGAIRSLRDQA
jgi:hypothetical protein